MPRFLYKLKRGCACQFLAQKNPKIKKKKKTKTSALLIVKKEARHSQAPQRQKEGGEGREEGEREGGRVNC